MIELIKKKLEEVNNLKEYTNEIMSLSTKTDDKELSSMIVDRQMFIESINLISNEIDSHLKMNEDNFKESDEIKSLKINIRESINEIINMDKEIRKNINAEIKFVKSKLNQPETTSKLLNIKI